MSVFGLDEEITEEKNEEKVVEFEKPRKDLFMYGKSAVKVTD